jgi:hypothetical protein
MVGLSVAATLLAVALVVGLLAWVRRDLRTRGVPMRAWWLVVLCYAFAAIVWLVAITVPWPIMVAWLATIPAALATIAPERLAASMGGLRRAERRHRPVGGIRSMAHPAGTHRAMAHPASTTRSAAGLIRRRRPTQPAPFPPPPATMTPPEAQLPEAVPGESAPPIVPFLSPGGPAPAAPLLRSRQVSRRGHGIGRRRWSPGDLRLAVELLEDAARIPDLDDAARDRIEARLDRLDRFRAPATDELLALVGDDVHARLATDVPSIDPDPARARRIAMLLDELDP